MLKENQPILEEVNLPLWHSSGYVGKDVNIVLIDSEGSPRKHMKDYYFDALGTQSKIGHATNVGYSVHVSAPGAKIFMVSGTHSSAKALEWIKQNAKDIDLINISLAGLKGSTTPKYLELESLGIPVICASGNDYYDDKISYPAQYPFTIGIGAWQWNSDHVAYYSNGGADLDAVTPSSINMLDDDGKTWSVSGTSFASPFACGMLACYIQWRKENKLPKLTPKEAREFIHKNCIDVEDEGFDYESGHGLFYMPEIPKITPPEPVTPLPDKPITAPLPPVQLASDKDKLSEKDVVGIMEQYFKDVGKSSSLFNDIQTGVDRGIAKGYSDGTFRPNQQVSRGETITFINRAIDYVLKEMKK